jgi:hypothetical protein
MNTWEEVIRNSVKQGFAMLLGSDLTAAKANLKSAVSMRRSHRKVLFYLY